MNSNTEELQVLKNTSALGSLIIKLVPKAEAKDLIVKNHYSHKWNEGGFGKYNFGIFRVYEKPASEDIHASESAGLDVRT